MSKRRHGDMKGPSQRQLRVGELIRRTLAEVLQRGDIHDPDLSSMSITVGEVRTSPDLRVATVHVMPLGGANVDLAIAALTRNRGELRRVVDRKLHLKYSPELRFVPDPTFDLMDETRRMLSDERVQKDIAGHGAGDDDPDSDA